MVEDVRAQRYLNDEVADGHQTGVGKGDSIVQERMHAVEDVRGQQQAGR